MTTFGNSEQTQRAVIGQLFPRAQVLCSERLRGGISSQATRWELREEDGHLKHVVVRSPSSVLDGPSEPRAETEARVLEWLAPTAVRAPRLLGFAREHATLVLEFVPGAPCFTTPPERHFVEALADHLALLHQLPVPPDVAGYLPQRWSTVVSQLAEEPAQLDVSLREPLVRSLLRHHQPPVGNPPVLLHGDYWPGNVLWQNGELVAVIDWEEAEYGEPLSDLSIARLDLLWAFGAQAMTDFTECYSRQVPFDRRGLPWWDLVAALRPALRLPEWASAYAEPPIDRRDITPERMQEGLLWFVDRAQRELAAR